MGFTLNFTALTRARAVTVPRARARGECFRVCDGILPFTPHRQCIQICRRKWNMRFQVCPSRSHANKRNRMILTVNLMHICLDIRSRLRSECAGCARTRRMTLSSRPQLYLFKMWRDTARNTTKQQNHGNLILSATGLSQKRVSSATETRTLSTGI